MYLYLYPGVMSSAKNSVILVKCEAFCRPMSNVLALTATAPRGMRIAIQKTLGMADPLVITASPDKPNIILSVGPYVSLDISLDLWYKSYRVLEQALEEQLFIAKSRKNVQISTCFSKCAWGMESWNPKMHLICCNTVS